MKKAENHVPRGVAGEAFLMRALWASGHKRGDPFGLLKEETRALRSREVKAALKKIARHEAVVVKLRADLEKAWEFVVRERALWKAFTARRFPRKGVARDPGSWIDAKWRRMILAMPEDGWTRWLALSAKIKVVGRGQAKGSLIWLMRNGYVECAVIEGSDTPAWPLSGAPLKNAHILPDARVVRLTEKGKRMRAYLELMQ